MSLFTYVFACVCAVVPSPKFFYVKYNAHKSRSPKKTRKWRGRKEGEGMGGEGRGGRYWLERKGVDEGDE